jgi:hypothetical protein
MPVEDGEDDWRLYQQGIAKWQLRKVLRQLFSDGWDWVSVLVEREQEATCKS